MRALSITGAWEVETRHHADERGLFLEWFQGAPFADAVGHDFSLAQANLSVSHAGVVRGIHFAQVPPGQAKYVTCPRGAVWDVVVDIRVGSPTFGSWDAVLLDDRDRRALYIAEGLGHGFMSLEQDSTLMYMCSAPYAPGREHGIDPFDPELEISWPGTDRAGAPLTPLVSARDGAAPTLAAAHAQGLLPPWDDPESEEASP